MLRNVITEEICTKVIKPKKERIETKIRGQLFAHEQMYYFLLLNPSSFFDLDLCAIAEATLVWTIRLHGDIGRSNVSSTACV
uniref:Uncharacterized protein n=1 Tax=Arundo donax TaxID=35708 RepID=A0A0A9DQE6_ARUDO